MTDVFLFIAEKEDSAGLEVARALRLGLDGLRLTAVSFPPHGPSLQADAFDEVWTASSLLDSEKNFGRPFRNHLEENGALSLPASPRIADRLAQTTPPLPGVVGPSLHTLNQIARPSFDASEHLPVTVPAWISLRDPVEDLHAFCRRHDWAVWMRTELGGAQRLHHWSNFDALRTSMAERWGTNELYLQRHVSGTPATLHFAAVHGELLETVLVRTTPEQPESFHTEVLSAAFLSNLSTALESINWHGGGALDLMVDPEGSRWLLDWLPCFARGVHGAARCGTNLPAQLLGALTDNMPQSVDDPAPAFTYLTEARPAPRRSSSSPSSSENRPSPSLPHPEPSKSDLQLDESLRALLEDLPDDWDTASTPRSVLLPTRTEERFRRFASAADRVQAAFDLSSTRVGLSIKTNPSSLLLESARASDMLAEAIHPDEMAHARKHGFDTSEIIVNGPVQALLPSLDTAPFALLGDAVSDLEALPFDPSESIVGVRTRPPERGESRFGVDLSCPDSFDRLCRRIEALPNSTQIGIHMHAPSSTLGHDSWWSSVARVLDWARTLQQQTGRAVRCLDLGGGWHPDDWLDVFIPALIDRRASILDAVPDLDILLLEPGKALSQPLGVVISRVIDARPSRPEVILDASIAELSNIDYHPHRLLAHTETEGWHRLPRGNGRLLGRLCMEADILGRDRRVSHLTEGDTIVVCDAGAYDMSMTYPFGRGRTAAK